jgi:hypothetical protein
VPGRINPKKAAEATRVRDARAVELRAAGASWQEVADAIGLKTASAARRAAYRSLDRVENENAATLRAFEDRGLMIARKRLIGALARADDRDVPKIVNSLVNLSARRAAMLGLNRPFEVEVSPGTSDAEFAIVTEALLRRAGREVPGHIAANAADARRQGFELPPTLAETPVVVDAEIVDEPEPLPDTTPAPVADLVEPEAVESLETALVSVPAWTDDGEIIAPFVVDNTDDTDDEGESAPDVVTEIVDTEPSVRPVAVTPQPEPRVRVDGWSLPRSHPLVARQTFQSGIDARRLA